MAYVAKLRYKKKGVNLTFYKTLLVQKGLRGVMNIPLPQSNVELAMLSEFLFGTPLRVRFDACHDALKIGSWVYEPKKALILGRALKLFQISKQDRVLKWALIHFRWECTVDFNSYYDARFNSYAHFGSYETDGFFWRTVFNSDGGGIARYSYGQCAEKSILQYLRLKKWIETPEAPARPEFILELNKLIEEDKKY